MPPDKNTVESRIKISADQSSISNTQKRIEALESNLKRLAKETDNFTNINNKQRGQIDRTVRALDSYKNAARDIGRSNKAAAEDVEQLDRSLKSAQNTLRQIQAARYDESFSKISRQVSSAGDLQSNLGALGGLSGAAGLGGAATGFGVAGEFSALVEELPRLKESIKGMPSALKAAADAIGVPGGAAGLVGAAGLAVGGFLVLNKVLGDAKQRAEEAAAAERSRSAAVTNANEIVNQVLVDGTVEAADRALQDVNRRLEEAQLGEGALAGLEQLANDLDSGVVGEVFQNALQALDSGEGNEEIVNALLRPYNLTVEELRSLNRDFTNINADDINESLAEYRQTISETEIAQKALTDLIESGQLAADGEVQAREQLLAASEQTRQQFLREQQLLQQSSEALEQRSKAIGDEQVALALAIQQLRESGDTSEETAAQIALYQQQLADLGAEQNYITQTALDLVRAREAEAEAMEEQEEKLKNLATATQKYNSDVERIREDSLQKQADLEAKYADQIVAIAEKAVEDSAKTLAKLEDRRAELTTQLRRDGTDAVRENELDQLEIQINAQRDEQSALRNHLRRLRDIRQRAEDAEFEAILNRDFLSLFKQRRQTTRDLQGETTRFSDEAQDRQRAIEERRQDLARAFQEERRQRQQKYEQDLADAQTAYEEERSQIDVQRQQSLNDAKSNLQQERDAVRQGAQELLRLRRQAIEQELLLISQGAQATLDIQARLVAQARALLSSATASRDVPSATDPKRDIRVGSPGTVRRRALGGALGIGQSSLVNERGTESFTSGGRTLGLPGGLGLFTPLQGGRVNPAGSGEINLNQTNNITNPDVEGVRKAVREESLKLFMEITKP